MMQLGGFGGTKLVQLLFYLLREVTMEKTVFHIGQEIGAVLHRWNEDLLNGRMQKLYKLTIL